MPFYAGQNRQQLRRMYLQAWNRFSRGEPLEPLQAQLAAVIAEHPEHIPWIESGEDAVSAEFSPAAGRTNPFLHLGLHLAIREQVGTDRPAGIRAIHQDLSGRLGGVHEAEHAMLESLAETLWEAQRDGAAPDEQAYLERLRRL